MDSTLEIEVYVECTWPEGDSDMGFEWYVDLVGTCAIEGLKECIQLREHFEQQNPMSMPWSPRSTVPCGP